jgi:Tol biopolymer transport system component
VRTLILIAKRLELYGNYLLEINLMFLSKLLRLRLATKKSFWFALNSLMIASLVLLTSQILAKISESNLSPIVMDMRPVWSPNGQSILFRGYSLGGNTEIYKIQISTSKIQKLTSFSNANSSAPDWSPSGTQIAFNVTPNLKQDLGESEIYIMNSDGSNPTKLTQNLYAVSPQWSPNGDQIAFESAEGTYLINADGSNSKRLDSPNVQNNRTPIWSPSSKRLLLLSSDKGIFLVNPDSLKLIQLSKDKWDSDPSWSFDAEQILYHYFNKMHQPSIWILNLNAVDKPRKLILGREGLWSPIEKRIAYFCRPNERPTAICLINADGSNLTNLKHEALTLSWSPDGLKIAFIDLHKDKSNLYIMNANGSDLRQLTKSI